MNTLSHQKVEAFLMEPRNYNRLQKQTQDDLSAGKLNLVPGQIYHRFELGSSTLSSGTIRLLKSDNNRAVAESSFQGKKMEASQIGIFNAMRVGYGEDAATGKRGVVKYYNISGVEDSVVPTGLINSLLSVRQGNYTITEQLIEKMISQVYNKTTTSGAYAASQAGCDKFPAINGLGLLVGDVETDITLEIPSGASVDPSGSNYGYIEIVFDGMITVFD